MGCHGGFSLEESTRRSWYNPEAVIQDLMVNMTFADIGCGDGFFSFLAARKVGEKGKVYAIDIDPQAIKKVETRAKAESLTNIVSKVGRAEDIFFCEGCVDFIFYSMDLHDFDDPRRVLQNARVMLKPGGRLLDLDWKKIDMPFGPPNDIRFSEKYAADLIVNAGFSVINIKDAGPYHYMIMAIPC